MRNIFIFFILISNIFYNKYYIALKNSQNLNTGVNYGIFGGTISSFWKLKNEFMITFYFKFKSFKNLIFPFISVFESNKILKEYIFNTNLTHISSVEEPNKLINIQKNIQYFCKFELRKNINNYNLKLKIFSNITIFDSIENNYSINNNSINDIIFILNRLNLMEDLDLENLIYYDCIDCHSNEDLIFGVTNILYFINFRNNYPNSKWLMNEIKNEFGPSLNGIDNNYENIFITNFNKNNKEIEWISSDWINEINFNPVITSYLKQFKINFSLNIFFKFDLFINYIKQISDNNSDFNLLNIYDNIIKINIDYINISKKLKINFLFTNHLNIKRNYFNKEIPETSLVNGKKFKDGNFFGIKFFVFNFYKNFWRNSYYYTNYFMFEPNSIFCTNTCLLKFSNVLSFDIDSKNIKILFNKEINKELMLVMYLKEFILGTGFLKLDNSWIIKSENVSNLFLIYHYSYKNIERRFSFNDYKEHSKCIINYCSICRKNLNVCEYCYENYYLSNENCILNTNNLEFVNNYSLLTNFNYQKLYYYSNPGENKIDVNFNIPTLSKYFLFNILINLDNLTLENVIFNIYFKNCNNILNIFYNIINYKKGKFNIVIPINNNNCINKIIIENHNNKWFKNNLVNFYTYIKKEELNCDLNYKDSLCELGCGRDNSYFIKFNDTLYYSNCDNSNLNYFLKNKGYFKYYYNCPFNCIKCDINSNDLIYCIKCEKGYILKNNECILQLLIDCNIESNYQISNNNSNTNLFVCDNICNKNYNNYSENIFNLIKHFNNSKTCENKDLIIIYCRNKINNFFNYYKNKCESCFNYNCFSFKCNNCNFTNNFSSCSSNYIFNKNKCIFNKYYDINCENYNLNIYLNYNTCNKCKKDHYLNNNNFKCYKRNTKNCIIYKINSFSCEKCVDNYFLNYLKECIKCSENCLNCKNNLNQCISCYDGYILENKKCIIDIKLKNFCLEFNKNDLCIKCIKGYYWKNYKCLSCNKHCISCENDKNCYKCENNFILFNNNCLEKLKNCKIKNNDNQLKCNKCLGNYFWNKSFKCKKCDKNCFKCENNPENCILCNKNGILIKDIKNNNYICKYNCINKYFIFDTNLKKCIKCKINNLKEYKLFERSFDKNILKFFENFNNIQEYSYFIIIEIPNYIDKSIINLNIKNSFKFKLEKINSNLNFICLIDKNYKNILLIPIINSYLEYIEINLEIINLFKEFKNCIFEKQIFKINIKNKRIKDYKNEILLKYEKKYPIYDKNSTQYKEIKNYYDITKTTTNTLLISSFILSVFDSSILGKLSLFLPTLLFFNFLIILKVNFGLIINTIFSFLNFNPKIYDISNYLSINKNLINKKLNHLLILNPKWNNLELISIYNITLNYLILVIFLSLLIFFIIIYFLMILYKISFYKLKISVNNRNLKKNKVMNIYGKKKDGSLIDLNKKFIFEKKLIKIKNILNKIIQLIIVYFFGIFISEIPNLIMVCLVYYSSISIDFSSFTSVIVIIIIFFNSLLVCAFFVINIYVLKFNKSEYNLFYHKIISYYKPYRFKNTNNTKIYYYKLMENIRLIFLLMIIFYWNYNTNLQIILTILIQIIFIIYIIISLSLKFFLIVLLVKEIFILIYLIFMIIIYNYEINNILENSLIIIFIIIFILSLLEFLISIIIKFYNIILIIVNHFKNNKWKKKKTNKIYISKKSKNEILKKKKLNEASTKKF